MLPREINQKSCSLTKGEKRYAVTLSIIIDKNGIADLKTLEYQ